MKKTIGILGGMGPETTACLFRTIISNTKAGKDEDHIPILILNDPKIPDRSAFIHGKGPSPVPALIRGSRKLEEMGADFIAVPCNTAHYFLDEISASVRIPVINMIAETAIHVKNEFQDIKQYGLLSTTGTYKTNIYAKWFGKEGLSILIPEEKLREKIMEIIYGPEGLKAGVKTVPYGILNESIRHLVDKGARAIISGCTEISLIKKDIHTPVPLIDPVRILALKSIKMAGYELKNQE
ncbi:MAG: amino acid racemase [Bacteroidales bacterium]|nr:MAG: amino acid racemase [Bacteroidales bacterium]